jgi:hypothetical protein
VSSELRDTQDYKQKEYAKLKPYRLAHPKHPKTQCKGNAIMFVLGTALKDSDIIRPIVAQVTFKGLEN